MKKFISTSLAFLSIMTSTSLCPNKLSAVESKSNIKFCLKSVSNILWSILPAILARAIFKSNDSHQVQSVTNDTFPHSDVLEKNKEHLQDPEIEIPQLIAPEKSAADENKKEDSLVPKEREKEEEIEKEPIPEEPKNQHIPGQNTECTTEKISNVEPPQILPKKMFQFEEKNDTVSAPLISSGITSKKKEEEKKKIDTPESREQDKHAQFVGKILSLSGISIIKKIKPEEVKIIELSDENFISGEAAPFANVDGEDPILITNSENSFKDKLDIKKIKLPSASYHDLTETCSKNNKSINNKSIIERYNKSNFIEYDNSNALIKFFITDSPPRNLRVLSKFTDPFSEKYYYLTRKAMEKAYSDCGAFSQDILSQIKYVKSDILSLFLQKKFSTHDEPRNIYRDIYRTIYKYNGKFYRILGFLGCKSTASTLSPMDKEECEKLKIFPDISYYKGFVNFTTNDGEERFYLTPRPGKYRFYIQPYFASNNFIKYSRQNHAVISLIPCDIDMEALVPPKK